MIYYTTVCDGCGEKHITSDDELPPPHIGQNLPLPDGWTEVVITSNAPPLPTVNENTSKLVDKAAKKHGLPKEATAVMDAYLEGMAPLFTTGARESRQSFNFCADCSAKVQLPKLSIR